MSGARIEITVQDGDLRAGLTRYRERAGDMRPLLLNIGEQQVQSTATRFRTGTGPDGAPWVAIKPATLKRRRRNRSDATPLTDRGYLGSRNIYQLRGAEELLVGNNIVYGGIHQFGGDIEIPARRQVLNRDVTKSGKIGRFATAKKARVAQRVSIGAHSIHVPARPYLGVSAADKTEILEIIDDHYEMEGAP